MAVALSLDRARAPGAVQRCLRQAWRGRPADARLFQIGTLGALLLLQITRFDFGADAGQAAVTIVAALIAQALLCRRFGVRFDWRSPLITGLSLSLLLRANMPALWAAAGALAMASKFLLRVDGKHVFNPACFAIVALLLTSDQVWVSPGIWGSAVWLAALLAGCAALVLSRAGRGDIALAFFVSYGGLLVARCLWLGDPLTIPLHQMQSGSVILFGCFMITDPRATPDDRLARVLFAVAVAALAYHLQFGWQLRTGLFWALAALSPATPLLDRWRPAARFRWTSLQESPS